MINIPAIDLKDRKTQILLAAAVAVIFLLMLDVNYILRPQAAKIINLINTVKRTRADLKMAEENISRIGQFKKEIEAYKDKVENYEKTLPAEQEIPSFLENLSNMAKSSNIKILAITPIVSREETDKAEARIYQDIPVLINARSGYHELGRFLSKLENSDRFMKVADIDVKGAGSAQNRHDIELLVLTYILLKNR